MVAADDTALVELARAGDSAAYGELFGRYHKRIYNYAYGIAGNREDAADVAQEAFVRVFAALPSREGGLNFSAYLYRTAHNAACDLVGARKRFAGPEPLELEIEQGLRADPERVALLADQQRAAREAAFSLPEQQRAVLELRELHEMSYQEIADVLEMPRNTVGVYLSRARLGFKEAFRVNAVDIERLAEECRGMLPLLSAYLDGELDAGERERVDAHLAECPMCPVALDEMREASKSYRALLPLLPPADVAEAVMREVDRLAKARVEAAESAAAGAEAGSTARQGVARRGLRRWEAIGIGAAVLVAALIVAAGGVLPLGDQGPRPSLEKSVVPTATSEATEAVEAEPLPEEGYGTPLPPPVQPPQPVSPPPDTEAPPTPALVSPADGTLSRIATVTLVWEAVDDPSGVTYVVEVESWNGKTWVPHRMVEGVDATNLPHIVDTFRQRWRVTAVDGEGNASAPSDWRIIGRVLVLIPPVIPYEPPELY